MELKFKVPVSKAQELAKDIRLLAKTGKDSFSRYLYTPIDRAGWRSDSSGQSARKIMERLENESRDESYIHTIGPRCKRLICAAMGESLSALGDSSIFFLEKMQLHVAISASPEAIEFADIISKPMTDFRNRCSQKNEVLFREKVSRLDADELKLAMEPVRLEANTEKVRIDTEIRRLYDNILIASKYNNLPKCRKILSTYIVRYCDDPAYAAALTGASQLLADEARAAVHAEGVLQARNAGPDAHAANASAAGVNPATQATFRTAPKPAQPAPRLRWRRGAGTIYRLTARTGSAAPSGAGHAPLS